MTNPARPIGLPTAWPQAAPDHQRCSEPSIPPTDYYPVALGTSLAADRWSLLIVRELSFGVSGFNELLRGLPGLSRSLLSARLRYLQRIGVVFRRDSLEQRYVLTQSGEDLRPVVEALGNWAIKHQVSKESNGEKMEAANVLWRMHRSLEPDAVPRGRVSILVVFDGSEVKCGWVQIGLTKTGAWSLGWPEHDVDITVNASVAVLNDLWWGRRSCDQTIAENNIILDGPSDMVQGYRSWFPNRPGTALASSYVSSL